MFSPAVGASEALNSPPRVSPPPVLRYPPKRPKGSVAASIIPKSKRIISCSAV